MVEGQMVETPEGPQFMLVQVSQSEFENFLYSILYSYRLGLGDFNLDSFPVYGEAIAWLYFIVASVFVLIVMFNLLIAVVSETFARVFGDQGRMVYKDMVDLIVENEFLVSEFEEKTATCQEKYLVIIVPEDNAVDPEEQMQQNFEDVKASIAEQRKEHMQKVKEIEYSQDRIIKSLKNQDDELADVKALLADFIRGQNGGQNQLPSS